MSAEPLDSDVGETEIAESDAVDSKAVGSKSVDSKAVDSKAVEASRSTAMDSAAMDSAAVREAFIQLWGSLGSFWGVSPTTARVFGWLLSRAEPADAVEIMEGLDLSRGAVSMACRELREWRLLGTERIPGSRRTLYHPETDFEKVVRHVVQIRKQREWDPILESLHEWIPALEENPSPEAAVFAERLKAMEALVELADSIAERFLKGGTVSNLGLKLLVGGAQRSRRDRGDHTRPPRETTEMKERSRGGGQA